MTRRHPIPQRRRQQERLIPIHSNEVLRHQQILQNTPDSSFPDSHGDKRVSETEPVARIVFVFRRDAGKRLTRRHIDGRSAVDCI
jgi:hypothetical protein